MSDPIETPAQSNPPQIASPTPGPRRLTLLLCVLGIGGLFFANTWKRDFWEPDESLFAQISRTMASSGDWIVPRSHEVNLELPPLTYWLAAGLQKLTGLDPRLAYRIPVTLAAIASLCLTYTAGKKFFDSRIGFLALWIQASTCYFFFRSAWLDDDLIFAACVQLGITCFALATRREGRAGLAYLGWAGLAFSGLAKSAALGVGLVFGSMAIFLFVEGGFTAVKQGFQRMRLKSGLLLLAAIAAPWFLAAGLREGAQLWTQYLLGGHVNRVVSSPVDARPPYFYLVTILWAFLPWTLFLPSGFLHGKDRLRRNGERLAFVWALFMLVALTCVSSKRPGYLLVIWPPLSLLIAAALFETRESFTVWEDLLRDGVSTVLPVLLKAPLLLVLVAAAAYYGGYLEKLPDQRAQALFSDREGMSWTFGLAVLSTGVLFAVSARVRKLVQLKEVTRSAFELACASVFLLFSATFLFSAVNSFESGRAAVEKLSSQLPPGASIATYGSKRAAISYYMSDGPALLHLDYPGTLTPDDPGLKRLEEHLRQTGAAFLITSRAELDTLRAQFPSLNPLLMEKASARLGWQQELVLVGNR